MSPYPERTRSSVDRYEKMIATGVLHAGTGSDVAEAALIFTVLECTAADTVSPRALPTVHFKVGTLFV